MKKLMTYQHLDTEKTLPLEFNLFEEDGHWVAKLRYLNEESADLKAPTFYGATADQAERQLRKVIEKDYELVKEEVINE